MFSLNAYVKLRRLLVGLLLITTACSRFLPVSTPEPTATETLEPTATPLHSPLAEMELPPTVVEFSPKPGQELVPEDALLTVRFDQAMDHTTVEQALQITPKVETEARWENDRLVHFRPRDLSSATRYRVTLSTEARSTEGRALSHPLAFSFSTTGGLVVTHVTPADGATDLRLDSPLLIAFNRPVIPLACSGAPAGKTPSCPDLPLNITPYISGEGFWVNTALYRFTPRLGWEAGERYTVELSAGLTAVNGALLREPYRWSFTFAQPRVLSVSPQQEAQDVLVESGLRVIFNTPMDPEATGSAFTLLSENGEPVPGAITWQEEETEMVFTPTQTLALDTRYTAAINEGARALTGAPVETPRRWSFTTVPYPAVESISPADGVRGYDISRPVHIAFAGAIDRQVADTYVTITPTVSADDLYSYWDGNVLRLAWDKEPRTEYCVGVAPDLPDRYGNTLETGVESCFTTGDLRPVFAPATPLSAITLDAAEPPEIYVLSRNVDLASLTLLQMNERAFIDSGSVEGTQLRSWVEYFRNDPNVTEISPVMLTRRATPLPTGYYGLTWDAGEEPGWRTEMRIAVVDRHVTLKLGATEALVWVTELRSGEPVTATEVRLLDETATLIAAGTTDADGVARIPIERRNSLWERVAAVVGQPGAPGFGITLNQWFEGASPWNFDIAVQYGDFAPYHVYLYSDRPLYRPGQMIHVRGILRAVNDARYTLTDPGREVTLSLRDPRWNVVYTTTTSLSNLGGFAESFYLSPEAPLGSYAVIAELEDVQRTWELPLTVAAYRKPKFEVTVTPERDEVLDGENIRALVETAYFFGNPVRDARVQWEVRAHPTTFTPQTPGRWQWQTPPRQDYRYKEPLAEGEGVTDAGGHFLIELPADLSAAMKDETPLDGPQRWTLEATVTDESGFPVSARAAVNVHPARFYLGLRPRNWVVLAGEKTTVDVAALDWAADPVSDQEVEITLAERTWYQIPASKPFAETTWAYTDTVVSTLRVTTGDDGRAEAVVTPPTASPYVVKATAVDAEGNPVRSETSLWVSGPEGQAWRIPEGTVTPVANAERYRPGDTASIFVPTPFDGPFQMLMTVERGGVLEAQRLVIEEANPVVELPIESSYAPNVYVSFVIVKGITPDEETEGGAAPDVRLGLVKLPVEPVAQTLTVTLTADRTTTYTPGDEVELTVRTIDSEGRTVDAEVGLAVVDKAALNLMPPNAPSIEKSFYGEQPLGVMTGNSLLVLFNRISADLEALNEQADRLAEELSMGGIGGGGGGAAPAETEIRQEFPDTALWKTQIRTGPSGEAQVSFELPDSLTTWVADARAVTADTRVGQAQTELVVSKPLLVQPVTPRFFVAGDRLQLAAVVHNTTEQALDVTTRLDASGLSVTDEPEKQINVPAGGRTRVAWNVEVPTRGSDTALLTFSAEGGGYADATRPTLGRPPDQTLPIYRYESPDVMGTAGVLSEAGSRLEAIALPPESGAETALTVQVQPSLAAGLLDALTYLETAGYHSTEQIVSRFLPNLLTYRTLQDLEIETPELKEELDLLVRDALDRLYGRQHEDGGWGWWSNRSHLQVTAYVTLGLLEAQRAGFTVRTDALHQSLDYLTNALTVEVQASPHNWTRSHAMAFYVLSLAGEPWPDEAAGLLYAARDELGTTGQAFLALGLGTVDPADRRVTTLLNELRDAAEITATGVQWHDTHTSSWSTDVRATAVVLEALVRLAPEDGLAKEAVRWLMTARRADRWTTTQEVAWTLIALTDYMAMTGEIQAEYEWGVALNGLEKATGVASPATLAKSVELRFEQADDPAEGLAQERTNALEIARGEGEGRLYYSAHLSLYRPVEDLEAESRGLTVERAYCTVTEETTRPQPCEPPETVTPGDLVEVRLTLTVPEPRHFVVLEDVYPAGMEPVDPTLLTEQQDLPEPGPVPASRSQWDWWWDPFEHRELRDERAVFFAQTLSPGVYQVRYLLRATLPGEYRVLPATASETYFPEVWGRTDGDVLRIQP
ncbi:MAG: Ig-like domain-containing protein [Anaerolineae bacterium]